MQKSFGQKRTQDGGRRSRIIILLVVASCIIIVFAIFATNVSQSSAATISAPTVTPAPVQSQAIMAQGVSTVSATPPVGNVITLPGTQANPALTLRSTTLPAPITQDQAMQVVSDTGVPWGLGGMFNGKAVTVAATFGLATFGQAGDTSGFTGASISSACAGWLGPCGLPIPTCSAGTCSPTGRFYGKFENTPIWLIDYGNTVWYNGGCAVGNCPPPPVYNHTVYAVDVVEKTVLFTWGYQGN